MKLVLKLSHRHWSGSLANSSDTSSCDDDVEESFDFQDEAIDLSMKRSPSPLDLSGNSSNLYLSSSCGTPYSVSPIAQSPVPSPPSVLQRQLDHERVYFPYEGALAELYNGFLPEDQLLDWPTRQNYPTRSNIPQDKPFSCNFCGRTFLRWESLSVHKRIHTGEKPYRCETCGKAFSQRGNLGKHRLTHTGQRPYSCDLCGKSFTQRSNMVEHRRIHTGEKPFACVPCGTSFTHRRQLSLHKAKYH